ncbi:hypothetical protein GPECTOR_77g22 [Gonium pectorale]|uniref:Uncharacterized protein n=1 Tax=Gonium pectorale TaxID=33097 RepID=A0A150G338_GONPE|nr:hypothetical protein GPECTOR_77g22 [Gonium pectorale]|eukprot:KXZ43925.1 hypothetical protein GPECTOR_77g22 [Gonium pectorale]
MLSRGHTIYANEYTALGGVEDPGLAHSCTNMLTVLQIRHPHTRAVSHIKHVWSGYARRCGIEGRDVYFPPDTRDAAHWLALMPAPLNNYLIRSLLGEAVLEDAELSARVMNYGLGWSHDLRELHVNSHTDDADEAGVPSDVDSLWPYNALDLELYEFGVALAKLDALMFDAVHAAATSPSGPAGTGSVGEAAEGMAAAAAVAERQRITADFKDKLLMCIGTIGAMGNGILLPLFAIVLGDFTDAFGGGSSMSDFMTTVRDLALKFLYLSIGALIASYLEAAAWMYSGNRQTNRLRTRFLASVLSQDVAFFDVHSTTGGLLQGLNGDSIDVQNAISEKLGSFLHHSTTFVAGFVVGFVKGWDMALVMLGCMPFLAIIGGLLAKGTAMANAASAKAYADASAIAQQSIAQIRTVAAYSREEAAMAQYGAALVEPRKMGIRQAWISGLGLGAINVVIYGTYAVGLFYGAYRVAAGVYTGGQVLMVLIGTLMGGFSLGQAAPNLQHFAKGRIAGARMFRVIDRQPAILIDGGDGDGDGGSGVGAAAVPAAVAGEIELKGVDFAYPSRPDVLLFRGFSIHVPAGKTVALVGSSGSGKSTVVQLIERFYDPLAGSVTLDGRDLRSLPLKWLRKQMGLVSQEPTLFATSIYQNIAIGLPGCSAEEVEAAARAANVHGFVSALPQGYQTEVGERGVQLSGGQKQRIAIARAILKSPKVMLLDEATSALDTRSEALVQAALDRLVVGRTTVVVAHRLSTIKHADAIAVVQGGRVVEVGTHEELLRDQNGAYSVLVKLQMEAQQRREPDEVPEGALEDAPSDGSRSGASEEPDGAPVHSVVTVRTPAGAAGAVAASAAAPPSADSVAVVVADPAKGGHGLEDGGSIKMGGAAAAGGKGEKGKEKKKDKEKPYEVSFRRLLSYAQGEGLSVVVGCVGSVGAGAAHPAFGYIMASMIGIFYTTTPSELRRRASFYSWMFFVIGVGGFVSLLSQQVAFGRVAQAVAGRVRAQLFGAILHQEVAWFDHADHNSGKLTSGLATDAAYVRGAVADVFGLAAQNVATLVLGYIVAFAYDWRMALLITGIMPFLVASSIIHLKFHTGFTSNADKLYAGANQTVTEAFASIRVIHAYNLQGFVCGIYETMILNANRFLVRQSNLSGLAYGYSQFMMFAMYSLIIYFMGEEISHGWSNFSDSLIAFLVILMAAMGMAQVSLSFPDLGNAKAAVQRVFPIIDRKPTIDSADPAGDRPDPKTLRGEIEFRAVRFAYPSRPGVVVFNNFNLTVSPGCVTALVGESGSGKSTVVGLIERFYEPLSGAVLFDGVDVRSYNLKHLRSLVGLVSQEPLLFTGTIAENIRIGKPDATDEEITAAADAANARDFVEGLPDKYDTKVGEGGIQLSGGQKQRVAIARAVIRNPKVLLLDEATSALDARCEAAVQAALDRIMEGRTSLVIAHRLSTIRHAHTIAVVYRGAVLEKGNHDELMALPNGSYARLVAAQSRGDQQAGGGAAAAKAAAAQPVA